MKEKFWMEVDENGYGIVWRKVDSLMSFLRKVDDGYQPDDDEILELSEITIIRGWIEQEMGYIPRSIGLINNLQELDLGMMELDRIESLAKMNSLEQLTLRHRRISDITALSSLTNLRYLDLGGMQISDITALSNLINLQHLDLSGTQIDNITALSNLTNLQFLDLSGTQINNISALSEMVNLKSLILGGTQIKDLGELIKMTNLQYLDLSATNVVDISVLGSLTQLRSLNVCYTDIIDFDTLSYLTNLRELDLDSTQILDISILGKLNQLESLDLSNTQIIEFDAISTLYSLKKLHLRDTQFTEIGILSTLVDLVELNLGGTLIVDIDELSKLKKLQKLYLSETNISSVRGISNIDNLTVLSVRDTRIIDFEEIRNLKNLKWLDISNTFINSIPTWIGEMKELRILDLSGLVLHSLPVELLDLQIPFYLKNPGFLKQGILLDDTVIATQPMSLFEQPRELIHAYYDSQQIPVNEAKVIFLGDGGAGKTHTIQRIHNEGRKDKYETETTPGINITNYTVEDSDRKFNIHFWDFGGQEIMHAMHRCFLTDRTCYVVVVSNRWDLNSRARYWLKNIDSFAKGAPVILAINQWDNIQETGIDMNRLTKDYPNLVKQPIFYSAKNSSDAEFGMLMKAIIHEAGKLDSAIMSFPVQWAAIRKRILEMAENRHYIDREEYHQICDQQELKNLQIRTWLLEWFNDLGVCFSYHQDTTEKNELASYKVLNPRWLTNAIYIIINAGMIYADKGRLNINLIQNLLEHPEFGVLAGVSYTENEREYVLDVMRKFNLSYSVSKEQEFIPALCESQTPENLHPREYTKRISYKLVYPYLPDSVVHQLMIRSYKNLNPDKIWRKGLRLDIPWLDFVAVVDMGNDDSTLQIDIYVDGELEPWKLFYGIRKDLTDINNNLGLSAEDYIVIHEDSADISKSVNELLNAKEQGINPLPIYNSVTGRWKKYQVDELLGMTFGEEVMAATVKRAQEEKKSLIEAFETIKVEKINILNQSNQPDAIRIIEFLIQHQCEENKKLMECLVSVLNSTGIEEAKEVAKKVKQDYKEKKNFLKRIEELIKPAANVISSGKTIYEGGKAVASAVQNAYPVIQEFVPQIGELFSNNTLNI